MYPRRLLLHLLSGQREIETPTVAVFVFSMAVVCPFDVRNNSTLFGRKHCCRFLSPTIIFLNLLQFKIKLYMGIVVRRQEGFIRLLPTQEPPKNGLSGLELRWMVQLSCVHGVPCGTKDLGAIITFAILFWLLYPCGSDVGRRRYTGLWRSIVNSHHADCLAHPFVSVVCNQVHRAYLNNIHSLSHSSTTYDCWKMSSDTTLQVIDDWDTRIKFVIYFIKRFNGTTHLVRRN